MTTLNIKTVTDVTELTKILNDFPLAVRFTGKKPVLIGDCKPGDIIRMQVAPGTDVFVRALNNGERADDLVFEAVKVVAARIHPDGRVELEGRNYPAFEEVV